MIVNSNSTPNTDDITMIGTLGSLTVTIMQINKVASGFIKNKTTLWNINYDGLFRFSLGLYKCIYLTLSFFGLGTTLLFA